MFVLENPWPAVTDLGDYTNELATDSTTFASGRMLRTGSDVRIGASCGTTAR